MIEANITIADIHANRIQMALNKLAHLVPFDAKKVQTFSEQDLLSTDLLVYRFGKLQDLLGAKIIPQFLYSVGEDIENLTMLDKINLLERLRIIENADLWSQMRRARNHASHEYPNELALTAEYLNDIVKLVPKLLEILSKLKYEFKNRKIILSNP